MQIWNINILTVKKFSQNSSLHKVGWLYLNSIVKQVGYI